MDTIFNKNLYFVKEHVGMFKAANNYDIYDPNTQEIILECREENLGIFTKIFRFTDSKTITPFEIEIRRPGGKRLLTIKRGISFWLSKVEVLDESNRMIGLFKQKFFSLGGKFEIHDEMDNLVATLKGKWTGWEFTFSKNDMPLAKVTKKWAGVGREMFTSADNYIIEIQPTVPQNDTSRPLIIAAVMCIDMVMKER